MAEGGVWRTVSGRRVFIKEGQTLTEAMKQSGKFKDYESSEKQKTKSGKYSYEYLNESNPDLSSQDKAFVVYDEKGNVVYKSYFKDSEENASVVKSNFEFNEEYNVKYFSKEAKRLGKLKKDSELGNYRNTKYGKQMYSEAEKIQQATGDVVKKIKIDKSEVSDSRYINMEINTDKYPSMNDSYTIRVSDHQRPAYSANGSFGGYDHYYDYEVVTNSFSKVDWDLVISDVINDINRSK